MKTAIVILNWNGEKYLKEFLAPLLRSIQTIDAEVIVADNNSTDGSVAYIENCYEGRIRTICLDKNYGFAEGYNKALQQIDAQYYLLLNSDVLVEKNWFYALEEWMEYHPDCAVCGPKIRSYARRDEFEYAGAAGGLMDYYGYSFCRGRILSYVEKDEGQYDLPEDVFWCSGACMMVRAQAWRELGGFDRDFFAHFEEIDFCWRAKLAAWRICYVPRSTVFHVGGGTLPQDSPWKLKLNYRNNLLTLSKNYAYTAALQNYFELLATLAKNSNAYGSYEWSGCFICLSELSPQMQEDLLESAAAYGVKSGKRRVIKRMLMDKLSALVYLFSGKKALYKAVIEAHKEFKTLRNKHKQPTEESVKNCLTRFQHEEQVRKILHLDIQAGFGKKVSIKGMFESWMVLYAYAYKDKAHEKIKKEIKL